jgi:hypothetical protein
MVEKAILAVYNPFDHFLWDGEIPRGSLSGFPMRFIEGDQRGYEVILLLLKEY